MVGGEAEMSGGVEIRKRANEESGAAEEKREEEDCALPFPL